MPCVASCFFVMAWASHDRAQEIVFVKICSNGTNLAISWTYQTFFFCAKNQVIQRFKNLYIIDPQKSWYGERLHSSCAGGRLVSP